MKHISREKLLALSKLLGTIFQHRDSDADGITRVANSDDKIDKDGYLGFSSSSLTLHTDRSGALEPPTLIILYCPIPAREGGYSLFVDTKDVYDRLYTQFPEVLEKLATPKSAIFGRAEKPFIGSIFNALPNDNIIVRFRYDNVSHFFTKIDTPIFLVT